MSLELLLSRLLYTMYAAAAAASNVVACTQLRQIKACWLGRSLKKDGMAAMYIMRKDMIDFLKIYYLIKILWNINYVICSKLYT